MRRKNKLLVFPIWIGIILMALAACGGQTGFQIDKETGKATVRVLEIVNQLEVNDLALENGNLAFVDLELGQLLQTGNLVKTHENSSARVDISIDQFTRVSRTIPETVWELGSFALDGEAVIELHQGKIFVFDEDDGKDHWPLHIETPAGTASARGTWMAVEFDPVTGTTQVECLRGICELENELGYQVFTNEHVVIATAVTEPATPTPMTEQQVEAFENLPEVATDELPIPVQFTQVEVVAKLNTAKADAIERKTLRVANSDNNADSSDDGSGSGESFPIASFSPTDVGENRSRSDESPGKNKPEDGDASNSGNPFNNENKVTGSSNREFGQSGGNGLIRARNDEAPGQNKPKDGDSSKSGNPFSDEKKGSGQSKGNGQIKARSGDAPGQNKTDGGPGLDSGKSSDKPDKKPSFAGQGGISSLNARLRKLGLNGHEARTLIIQGQAELIVGAIDDAVANGAGNALFAVSNKKDNGNGGNDNGGSGGTSDSPGNPPTAPAVGNSGSNAGGNAGNNSSGNESGRSSAYDPWARFDLTDSPPAATGKSNAGGSDNAKASGNAGGNVSNGGKDKDKDKK